MNVNGFTLPISKNLLLDAGWVESRHQPDVLMSAYQGPIICQTCGEQYTYRDVATSSWLSAEAYRHDWAWVGTWGWYCPAHVYEAEEGYEREREEYWRKVKAEEMRKQKRAAILRRYGMQVRRDIFEQRIIEEYGDE